MMLGNTGAFLASKLPYDAEVEYLESTGTQWIDTGAVWDSVITSRMEAIVQYTQTSGRQVACGSGLAFYFGCNANRWEWRYGTYTGVVGTGVTTVAKELTATNNSFYINGTLVQSRTENAAASWWGDSAYVFGMNSGGKLSLPSLARVFSFKAWIGGTLVRDLIPVRFTNELGVSEGAMYDRANPTVGMNPDGSARTDGLYRNRGTGAFLYGADKN